MAFEETFGRSQFVLGGGPRSATSRNINGLISDLVTAIRTP